MSPGWIAKNAPHDRLICRVARQLFHRFTECFMVFSLRRTSLPLIHIRAKYVFDAMRRIAGATINTGR